MIDRFRRLDHFGASRRNATEPKAGGRRRLNRRPTLEALEGRALLSVAGGTDISYNPDHVNFATSGFARIEFQPENIDSQTSIITGEALQPDGKDVLIGYLQTNPQFGSTAQIVSTIEVTRLNTDGTIDTSFGTNGYVNLPAPAGDDTGQAVVLQSNGKIVIAADIAASAAGSTPKGVLYRLNTDGSADTTFGTAGAVTFNFDQGTTSLSSSATTLAIDSGGNFVVGGVAGTVGIGVARFTAAGTPDATFGTAGQVVLPISDGTTTLADTQGVAGLAIQPGGAIDYDTTVVPASGTGTEIAVGQLTAAGVPDTTFGTGGQVILSGSTSDTAGALAVQSDGKVIVGGAYFSIDSGVTTSTTHYDVYRLNTDGSLDTGFGTMGEVTSEAITRQLFTIADNATQDSVNSFLIQANGTILVGGTVKSGTFSEGTPTIVSLNTDGSPNVNFGINGQIAVSDGHGFNPNNSTLDSSYGLVLQSDGKLLVAAEEGVGRLLASGASNDFDNDGKSDPAVLLTNFAAPIFAYRPSSGGDDVLEAFGITGAGQTLPAPGAYNGSGIDELGIYLPSIGAFGIRPAGTSGFEDQIIFIGTSGDGNSIPAPADYTGSGFTEVGVYEPATGAFVYSPTNSSDSSTEVTVPFGAPGAGQSIPVPADYDGSGHDEIAVYLPTIAAFAYRPAGTSGDDDQVILFGSPGAGNSIPVPGDYDGSGHTEVAVYLPALGAFAYRPYGTDGSADVIVPFGMPGAGNSIPMPGDYDGSGHTELAVYMPSLNAFAYRPYGTDGSADVIIAFGEPGAGNTVPFNAAGAATIQGGGTGGGGSSGGSIVPSWVDFVPDLASQPKKNGGGGSTTTTQGQS